MSARSIIALPPLGGYVTFPATPEQLDEIRRLGGHPPEGLSAQQAAKALNALRWRRGELRGASA